MRFWILALAALCLAAQPPKIGDVNAYGFHKLNAPRVLKSAGLAAGAELPPSRGDLEEKLEALPGVVSARVEVACCEGTDAIVFVGIEERGGPHFQTRAAPAGNSVLPEEITAAYRDFLTSVERAARAGTASEDYSTGEPRLVDPAARALQDRFAEFAAANLPLVREVLRNSAEADQRAAAAAIIGYAPKKDQVLNDLQYALQDVDESVRGNAVRALKAIAVLAQKRPELGLKIAPTWLVAMLNSIVLGDREQAAEALVILTDAPNPQALELMRERALPALVEMARWKTLRYALPPFLLVGRVGGVADADLQAQWQKGDRETAIKQATAPPKGRR